jgi:hypothetical protein
VLRLIATSGDQLDLQALIGRHYWAFNPSNPRCGKLAVPQALATYCGADDKTNRRVPGWEPPD